MSMIVMKFLIYCSIISIAINCVVHCRFFNSISLNKRARKRLKHSSWLRFYCTGEREHFPSTIFSTRWRPLVTVLKICK